MDVGSICGSPPSRNQRRLRGGHTTK